MSNILFTTNFMELSSWHSYGYREYSSDNCSLGALYR